MKKFNKTIKFEFNDSSFEKNKEDEKNRLRQGNIYRFNKDINDLCTDVEELDRIDDFGGLKIPLESYEEKGKYGIVFNEDIHKTGTVILPHQKTAAEEFLKTLRGFGLLADVVGSGKTFEAGVVLSELSARGKIKSLLIITPKHLIDTWKNVLEIKFGMGEGTIHVSKGTLRGISFDSLNRPMSPILISFEDFAKWDESYANYLFDTIVVDEAHNLCSDEQMYPDALYLLSLLMKTKKKYGNNYCLLLSATPHSGNLDKMFKLWYFIRCKGGNPEDFKNKSLSNLSDEFLYEKKYYHEVVCKNSNTVMEFIKHVKISEIENRKEYRDLFIEYLKEYEQMTYDNYNNLVNSDAILDAKIVYVDRFLSSPMQRNSNLNIKDNIFTAVANAYHNSILRSIMVRQSKKLIKSEHRVITKNIYYYPKNRKHEDVIKVRDLQNNTIRVHLDEMYSYNDNVIEYSDDFIDNPEFKDNRMSIVRYSDLYRPEGFDLQNAISELNVKILRDYLCDDSDSKMFPKKNTFSFISEALKRTSGNIKSFFKPYDYDLDDKENFDHKFEDLFNIFKFHKDNKIVVFFDYELVQQVPSYLEKFKNRLVNSEYKNRLLFSKDSDSITIQGKYEEIPNAILVCEDETFTEGINLQSGNVIVNFSITPDPLAMNQRIGRVDRLGQANRIYIYSLADINKLDGFGLSYLSAIGIMDSNSNDATIISGSSNEKMIAIHCPVCQRVKMIQKEKYELFLNNPKIEKKISAGILCGCKDSVQIKYGKKYYTLMKEFNVNNCKCTNCKEVFHRVTKNDNKFQNNTLITDGRLCLANVNDKMLLESDGSREFHCSKICAMKHCKTFKRDNPKCLVLEAFKENPNVSIAELMLVDLCSRCDEKCPEKCRPYFKNKEISAKESCVNCVEKSFCGPATSKKYIGPHVLNFDENWKAPCPLCHEGVLEPVVDSTFDRFIRSSWRFNGDNGEAFVELMLAELERVSDIKTILERDEVVNG